MRKLMQTHIKIVDELLIAVFLILFYVSVLLWNSISYFINSTFFSDNSFVFSLITILIFGLSINKYYDQKRIITKSIQLNLIYFFILLIILILSSTIFWDNSYDGQTYHLETITELSKGWNPHKKIFYANGDENIILNHYAKSFEIFGNAVYKFTGNIETYKASNLLLGFASAFISFSFLRKELELSYIKSFMYTILLSLNPIISIQIFTGLLDCQIACLFTILIISFLYFIKGKRFGIFLWASCIIILIGLKFTGLVYACLFAFFGVVYLLFYKSIKKKVIIFKFLLLNLSVFIISVGFVSYNPYCTNLQSGKHLFYPLMGEGAINIMIGTNSPESFSNRNRIDKFFTSNFSTSGNVHGNKVAPEPKLKLPFSFRLKEWTVFKSASALYGGLGPLFSGILLLGFLLLLYLSFNDFANKYNFLFLFSFIILTIFVLPECWLARYVPQLWIAPIILLIFFEIHNIKSKIFEKICKATLYIYFVNAGLIFLVSMLSTAIITQRIKSEYQWIKNTKSPVTIVSNGFISTEHRLSMYNIPFKVENDMDTTNFSNSLIFKPILSLSIILLPKDTKPYTESMIFKKLERYVRSSKSK